jgi:hypothetical protein
LLGLVFALAVVHGLLYAALTPPWQAPDEIAHFEYASLLGRLRRPLSLADASPALEQAIIQSLYDHHAWAYVGLSEPAVRPERLADALYFGRSRTLTRFSLTYVVYALAALPFQGAGLLPQLYAMRVASVVLSALVVVLTYRLAQRVDPASPALAWGSALFVLFLPQHAFITAAVSDGILAELLATLAIYGLVSAARHGLTAPRLALIGLSSLGALLSKTTAVFLLPLMGLAALVFARRWYTAPSRTAPQRRRALLALLLTSLGLAVLGALLIAWLNRVSYQIQNVVSTLAATLGRFDQWSAYVRRLLTSGELAGAWSQTFESFWAYFGWMVVRVPRPWVWLLGGFALLALLGWGWRWLAGRRGEPRLWPKNTLYSPVAWAAALSLLVLLAWFVSTPVALQYSQGRYVFAAIAPLALLLAGGWLGWRPPRDQGLLLVGLLALWVLFDAAALLEVLLPYFYRAG